MNILDNQLLIGLAPILVSGGITVYAERKNRKNLTPEERALLNLIRKDDEEKNKIIEDLK